eukprot:1394429-Amorphochlora_amoeboformis.AAC.1
MACRVLVQSFMVQLFELFNLHKYAKSHNDIQYLICMFVLTVMEELLFWSYQTNGKLAKNKSINIESCCKQKRFASESWTSITMLPIELIPSYLISFLDNGRKSNRSFKKGRTITRRLKGRLDGAAASWTPIKGLSRQNMAF